MSEIKSRLSKIKYTMDHRRYVYKVWAASPILRKKLPLYRVLLHDLDKVPLYLIFGKDLTSKWHNRFARHHNWKTEIDIYEAIADWDSARFTKPDKPLDAMETWKKYYSDRDIEKQINLYYSQNRLK